MLHKFDFLFFNNGFLNLLITVIFEQFIFNDQDSSHRYYSNHFTSLQSNFCISDNLVVKEDNIVLNKDNDVIKCANLVLIKDNIVSKKDNKVLNKDNAVLNNDNVVLNKDNKVLN